MYISLDYFFGELRRIERTEIMTKTAKLEAAGISSDLDAIGSRTE